MNFYEQLQQIPHWVCWDFAAYKAWDRRILKYWKSLPEEIPFDVFKNKKEFKNPHKKPLQPNGYGASSTNSDTWNTYEICKDTKYEAGFVLTDKSSESSESSESSDSIVVLDLDHCFVDQKLTQFAMYILKLCSSGTEVSQSGTGLHIFGLGKIPCAMKTKTIEVYNTERYICTTGNILLDLPLNNIQNALNIIYSNKKINKKRDIKIEKSEPVSDDELNTLLENERFNKLWNREIEYLKDDGGPDFSRYDFNIALALKKKKPELVLGVIQKFRKVQGFPRKHLGALHNCLQKTSEYKDK